MISFLHLILQIDRHCKHASFFFFQVLIIIQEKNKTISLSGSAVTGRENAICHSIKDMILCSICLEVLEKPKLLRCGHSFCLYCLQQYKTDQSWSLHCPECRKNTNVPDGLDGLPADFRSLALKDMLRSSPADTEDPTPTPSFEVEPPSPSKPRASHDICKICSSDEILSDFCVMISLNLSDLSAMISLINIAYDTNKHYY